MSGENGSDQDGTAAGQVDADRIAAVLLPLLGCLERLNGIQRHMHPPALGHLLSDAGRFPDLRAARPAISDWPDHLGPLGEQLAKVADHALSGFDELNAAVQSPDVLQLAYKALRHVPKAMEALYPLAGLFPSVSRFFLDPDHRDDPDLLERLTGIAPDGTGVLAVGKDITERSTVWFYVPETIAEDTPVPLIVAMHGGAGKGRGFLWSWIRTARSRGAVLIAPTSLGSTWALQGDDIDSPHLAEIVKFAQQKWSIDPARMLLTGMSDGGTFTYVSGLGADSPFTHLAPFSAAFHPMLGEFADRQRLKDLPIHIVHGRLDWMFPAEMAGHAHEFLQTFGARVTCRVIDDLSHTYASDLNGDVMDWMNATVEG